MNTIDSNNEVQQTETINSTESEAINSTENEEVNYIGAEDSPKNNNLFSSRLKQRRKELGFSQKEAANRVGVSISAYIRYEHGYIPTEKILGKITEGLQVNRDWLIGMEADTVVELKPTRRNKSQNQTAQANRTRKVKENKKTTESESTIHLTESDELKYAAEDQTKINEDVLSAAEVSTKVQEIPDQLGKIEEANPFETSTEFQPLHSVQKGPNNEGLLHDQFNYLSSLVTMSIHNRDWEMVEATLQLLKMIDQRQQS